MNVPNVFPWQDLEQHFRTRLAQVDKGLRRAEGDKAAELRGKAQLLEELLNLPQTFAMLNEQAPGKP